MDYWSALAELGLSEDGLTRDRVRRTYLRRLKAHPPEKDPEGFKRLRSAFELLRERVVDEEPEAAPAPEPIVVTTSVVAPVPAPVFAPEPPMDFLPLPPLAEVEKPLPMPEVLKRVTTLLDKGQHQEARTVESRWREQHDDHREVPIHTLARWELVRELLGVADQVPRAIVQILSRALRDDPDLNGARTQLELYRVRNEKEAGEASSVIFIHARNLSKQIEGTLWVPQKIEVPRMRENLRLVEEMQKRLDQQRRAPPRSTSGGGAWLIIVALIILGALVRVLAGTSSTSPTYMPRYKPIEIPQFRMPEMVTLPKEALFIPPPMPRLVYRDDTPALMTSQIVESSHVLQNYEITSWQQKDAAVALERAVDRKDCLAMRAAVARLTEAPPTETQLRKVYADMHLDAIKQRLEHVCPARKKK